MYQIRNGWIVFNNEFNGSLSNVVFPMGIQKVKFNWYFNQDMRNLPNNLTHLIFGGDFNQDVSNLPNSLTHLTFGYHFNQEMHNLPNSLTYLTFGYHFNQDVSNLPNSLTHLTFSHYFNQDVSQLPKSITYLKFYDWNYFKFNHNLNPYLYHLTEFNIKDTHKHKSLMLSRCRVNRHNISIREDKLIDLLLKN